MEVKWNYWKQLLSMLIHWQRKCVHTKHMFTNILYLYYKADIWFWLAGLSKNDWIIELNYWKLLTRILQMIYILQYFVKIQNNLAIHVNKNIHMFDSIWLEIVRDYWEIICEFLIIIWYHQISFVFVANRLYTWSLLFKRSSFVIMTWSVLEFWNFTPLIIHSNNQKLWLQYHLFAIETHTSLY